MVSACAACDCMCQKGTGCREVAELGTQMWPLQPLLLLRGAVSPRSALRTASPQAAPRPRARMECLGFLCPLVTPHLLQFL